jgi:TonB family protein
MHRTFVCSGMLLLWVSTVRCDRREGSAPMRSLIRLITAPRPDEPPALVTSELPFHYPAALYAQKAQGNVTLRLFIDRDGRVSPESTRVEETSGFPALDSAAIDGARSLRFVPAKLHGEPLPVTILFPVYFRHPEARPLPGDSVLQAVTSGFDGA